MTISDGPATIGQSADGRGKPSFMVLILAALLVVAVLIVVMTFYGRQTGTPSTGGSATATSTPGGDEPTSPPARSAPIAINPTSEPPLCAAFTGSGDIPKGRTLWLAVLSDEPRYYFFPTVVEPSLRQWTAENVTLGVPEENPGEPFTVFALLADANGDQNVEKLNWKGANSIPSGLEEQDRIHVKRGKDERQCQE
jgi:hypothetical protein